MANSTLREVSHLAKFNGQNFSLWKFGTWLLLEQHNLIKVVNGEEPYPVEILLEGNITNADARADWLRRDVMARNYLVATIENQQQRSLINCRTAYEMWTRLSAQHLRNAVENQHVLQQRFFEYQYQPDHDIMSHITEVETMASQLSDVGAPVTEIQIMTKILCTLPPSYRSFTTAWDSVPATERTIGLLTSRLLKEETMARRWTKGHQDAHDAAFFAQNFPTAQPSTSRGAKGGRANKNRGGANRGGSSRYRPYTRCTYCQKGWHTADVCRSRIRDQANAQGGASSEAAAVAKQTTTATDDNSEYSLMSDFTYFAAHCISDWFADSGATQHMSGQRSLFKNFMPVKHNTWFVNGIGGTRLQVHGHGEIAFTATINGCKRSITVKMVLYVPGLGTNLLSIAAVTEVGVTVHFIDSNVSFKRSNEIIIVGKRIGRTLYHLAIIANPSEEMACFTTPAPPPIAIWHQRLAHISFKKISKMASQQVVDGLLLPVNSVTPNQPCYGCMAGKMKRSPFPVGRTRAVQIGNLIHSDVCGPMHISTPGGARFFVLFTDDFSGFRTVYFLKQKSEVADRVREYADYLRTETGQRVHTLRTDNGGEFTGQVLRTWMCEQGVRAETSAPHTPEQNGVSERANRTIVEGARCLIHAKHLPLELWGEAISCTVYTLNRVTTKTAPTTPYQNWYGKKPDLSNLRIFGSTAYIHVPKAERRKLDSKSLKCFFVGYCVSQKAYRFWDPITRRIKISRDVIFDEQILHIPASSSNDDDSFRHLILNPLSPNLPEQFEVESRSKPEPLPAKESLESVDTSPDQAVCQDSSQDVVSVDQVTTDPISTIISPQATPLEAAPTSKPTYVRTSPYPLRTRIPRQRWDASLQSTESQEPYEPESMADALSSPDALLWKRAAQEEYDSLISNKTWTLTQLPSNRTTIKSRWVFKVKPGTRDTPPRFKARLVAKGYSQRYGIDYEETFAPVAKQDTLRVVLSFVAAHDLEMYQLDIKTAFLYGELSEEIYLEQPEGYAIPGQEHLVCRLHKCLYGLKQASRVWNNHFDTFLRRFGLIPSKSDPCLYLHQQGMELTMVVIWVDDGLVCSSNRETIFNIINYLGKHFEMRSSAADQFVGLSITRDRKQKTLYVSQPDYTRKILRRYFMDQCHPVQLPAVPGVFSNKNEVEDGIVEAPFREAVGSLMYLMLSSRPDIAFAVNQISQFCEKPQRSHWSAAKRILSYIHGTSEYGIRFGPSITPILGFTDADYAGDVQTRQSTSGFVFLLNGGPVAWNSRRQRCVALSTTEAEYVAACEAVKEGVWLRRLIQEIVPEWKMALPLMCDNMSSIDLIKNPKFHQRTKHIDVRYHFIRAQQEANEIDVKYVPTTDQLADPFTKPLAYPRFSELRKAIAVVPTPTV